MAANSQPEWRLLARQQFPGFSVTGTGPFAVPYSGSSLIIELFEHELLARSRAAEIGAKMFQLQLPEPRRQFRAPHIRD
jgi:hypothetical protein